MNPLSAVTLRRIRQRQSATRRLPGHTPSRGVERWLRRGILALLLAIAATAWMKVLGLNGSLALLAAALLFGGMVLLFMRPLIDLVFGQHRRDAARGEGPHAQR